MTADLRQISTLTKEGKWLIAALAKITTESQTDKTPNEVLGQIIELADKIYPPESTPEGVTADPKDEEIARLKDDVEELVECLDLIVGSMSLERVERFELNEKAKSLIQKHEQ